MMYCNKTPPHYKNTCMVCLSALVRIVVGMSNQSLPRLLHSKYWSRCYNIHKDMHTEKNLNDTCHSEPYICSIGSISLVIFQ